MAAKKSKNPFEIPGVGEVKSQKDAAKMLRELLKVEAEISRRINEAGIPELSDTSAKLKTAVTDWAVATNTERIEIDDGHHATLISQFYDARFVGTADDISGDEQTGVIPLRNLLRKKFGKERGKQIWTSVTRRYVDKDLLEEVIADGILTVDDVAPCYVEKAKKPYLRVFTTGE